MTRIIRVRGIGEPTTNNLLSHVTRLLSGVPVVELPWSATYGPVPHLLGTSFSASTGDRKSVV